MTEENKDLKSERYEIPECNDLRNAFDGSCGHRQWLFARYNDAYADGFRSGQVDLQIKAKKILDTFDKWEADVLVDVFGITTNIELLYDIKTNYEKIVAYEKQRIKVGDVVKNVGSGKPLLVYKVASPYVYILDRDGQGGVRSENDVVKTGKHYPIDEILKELGNETNE